MDIVKQNEIIAQTPEQTLADYARLDAIIAKGTYTNKWPKSHALSVSLFENTLG